MRNVVNIGRIGDIHAIRNVLACHSRGVDRADAHLLASCYHEDGTVDYRFFVGPAGQFAEMLTGAQKSQPVTLHRTAQMWIELEGDRAVSESYVMAYASGPDEDGAMMQRLICGRYLDRHEKRRGEWRMTHRTYVLDTNVNWHGGFEAPALGFLGHHVPTGGHGTGDPGIALLGQAAAKSQNSRRGARPVNQPIDDDAIDAIVSRQQIADITMAYCRGVDRADERLLADVFHEESTVVSGPFNGNGKTFAAEICRLVKETYEQTFHSIANQWIEVEGDAALGETYVIAVSTSRGDESTETLTGGRYIDRFERRDGRWAVAERTFVLDWMRNQPSTRQMEGGMYGALDLHGCRGEADPVYAFMRG